MPRAFSRVSTPAPTSATAHIRSRLNQARPGAACPPRSPPAGRGTAFLGWNNVVLGALYHGIARAARDWPVRYLNERTPANLGRPLATLPRFQAAVGEIEAWLLTGDRRTERTRAGWRPSW
ncbi:hypothetical protein ACFOWE_12995 [Planomonospora corallina]|uniref:Uncharacterized protein n=1 Tax=Planomonospora corallina TaxID=1806052 RepID=A0ABV8I4V1_9ACTN